MASWALNPSGWQAMTPLLLSFRPFYLLMQLLVILAKDLPNCPSDSK